MNRFVERLSDELCSRGHRVVVVAPSDSRELVRDGRAKVKALQLRSRGALGRAGLRLHGGGRPVASVPARRLRVDAARRVAHARGSARPGRARFRARARALCPERFVGRPAALARAERRHVPLDHRALRVHADGAQGGGAALRAPRRPHGELRGHPRPDRALFPGRLHGDPPRRGSPATRREDGRPARDRVLGRGGARRAAAVPARAPPPPDRPRLARHDLAARAGVHRRRRRSRAACASA